MSRVFVVQRPSFLDRSTGRWEDKYDLSPASDYGRLVVLLPRGIDISHVREIEARLRGPLGDFGPDDYLLALGDPVAIAVAASLATLKTGGELRLLKWNRIAGRYDVRRVDLRADVRALPR